MTQSTSTARNGPGNAHPSGRPDLRAHRLQRLAGSRLYVCTDARRDRGDLEEFLHAAYAGGVDIIQLRDRTIDTVEELAALEILGQVAAEHGKLFAVNDRADIANLASADVLHVGQRDLTPAQARQIVGPDVIIGRSTHHRDQVRAAIADPDTDYFCTGPVWATPTKLGRAAAGLGLVQDAAELAPEHAARGQVAPAQGAPDQSGASGPSAEPDVGAKPWFAIGGIDAGRLPQVQAAGASRAVVVRAITDAADPRAAAAELRGLLTG